jgi:hypothetical protein
VDARLDGRRGEEIEIENEKLKIEKADERNHTPRECADLSIFNF